MFKKHKKSALDQALNIAAETFGSSKKRPSKVKRGLIGGGIAAAVAAVIASRKGEQP